MLNNLSVRSDRIRLGIFLTLLIVLLLVFYVWPKKINKEQATKENPVATNSKGTKAVNYAELERIDIPGKAIPEGFFVGVAVFPGAEIVEVYYRQDHRLNINIQAVMVLQTTQGIEKVWDFYKQKLKESHFRFVVDSDAKDTDIKKTLVYSTGTGIIVINIEKSETGSKVTLQDSNLLIRLQAK